MKLSYFSLFIFLLLFLASCQDNETLEESVLIQDDNTFISAVETEDFITINVESLSDITDNRGGATNENDYCNISFDINSNNSIDSEIDFGYESPTANYDICSYYFLESESITHCGGHPTTAVFTETFASSAASTTPHMIWSLKISKEELNDTRNLSFIVKTIDKGSFTTYPPFPKGSNPILFTFEETLNFKW